MIALQPVHSHEDEPAWGHLIRAELVCGSHWLHDIRARQSGGGAALEFLAACDWVTPLAYSDLHGDAALLGSMARWNWHQPVGVAFPLLAGGRGTRRDVLPRACQQCVRESVSKYGYACSQRRQNVAGVASCYKHGRRLFVAGTASERSQFRVELGQLEYRSNNPVALAYIDDFVRRYETALLMLLQCADLHSRWWAIIDLFKTRIESAGLKLAPREITDFVRRRANPEWLHQTFVDEPGCTGTLDAVLARAFDQPVYTPHHALLLAAGFDDVSELSTILSAHGFGDPIEPLMRAPCCNERRNESTGS